MLFVASIEIESLSPLMLSGADTSRADNVFRLTSLRGVVEWVFRALVAAAAIQLRLDEEDVSNKVASYVFGGENLSSRIIFRSSTKLCNGRHILSELKDKKTHRSSINYNNYNNLILSLFVNKVTCELKKRKKKISCKINFTHPRFSLLWMNLSKNILQKGTKNKDFLDIYNKVLSFGNRNSSLKFSWSFHTDKLDIEISPENEEFDDNKRDAIERFRDYFNKCLLEAISRSFSFIQGTISLYTSSLSVSVHENLALVSLALALLLFGLGKGSRRGLGAIKIKSIGINEDVDNELIRTKNHIEKAIENPINIVRLIDYGVNLATRLIEQLKSRNIKFRQRKEKMRLPKIPAFYEGAYQIIIKKINQQNRAPSQTAPLENGTQQGSAKEDQRNKQDIINLALWKEICRLNEKLFLRRGKLGLYLRSIREQQQAARRLDHYILGLPRSGSPKRNTKIYSVEIDLKRRGKAKLKETKKRKTGFAGEHQRIGRRASPIIISAINESFVVVTYFMSLDWPTKLVWFSAEKKETEEQKVKQRRRPPRKKEEDTREVEWRKLRDVLLDIARKLPRLICGGRLITC